MTELSDQDLLMRGLAVLQTLNYADTAAVPSNKPDRTFDTNADLRILDVIAAGLATGDAGDVVAAAFVNRSLYEHTNGPAGNAKTFIVLAKNTIPNIKDKKAATELFDAINNPNTKNEGDVFNILLNRCQRNMRKRVQALVTVLSDKGFRQFMDTRLSQYAIQVAVGSDPFNIEAEFRYPQPVIPLLMEKHNPSDFMTLWNALIDFTVSSGLDFMNAKGSKDLQNAYQVHSVAAYTILHSAFLRNELLGNSSPNRQSHHVLKLRRRLYKITIYTRAVGFLLDQAKKGMCPIKHFWIEKEQTGAGVAYGPFNRTFYNEFQGVLGGLKLSEKVKADLNSKLFIEGETDTSVQKRWEELFGGHQDPRRGLEVKPVKAYFHSELRIMDFIEKFKGSRESVGTSSWPTLNEAAANKQSRSKASQKRQIISIGVSKNSCIMCKWFLDKHNEWNPNKKYMTSGDHGKAYARWFHLRTEFTTEVLSVLKHHISAAVHDHRTSGGKKRVVSDEHLSSSDEERQVEETQASAAIKQNLVANYMIRLDKQKVSRNV